MLVLKDYSEKFYNKMVAQKAISKANVSKEQFEMLMMWFDYINSQPWDVVSYRGRLFSEIKITPELAGLILPAKVVIETTNDRIHNDLVVREDVPDPELNYDQIVDIIIGIYGSKKATPNFTTSMEDCRKIMNLVDVYDRSISRAGMVKENLNSVSAPLYLADGISEFSKESYRSQHVEDYMNDLWTNVLLSLKK